MTNPEIASNHLITEKIPYTCKVPNVVNVMSFEHSSSVMCKQLLSIQGISEKLHALSLAADCSPFRHP